MNTPPPAVGPYDQRNLAAAAHASALVGLLGVPGVLGPLIVWILAREGRWYVDDQGKEAVNFQLSILIYGVGLALAALVLAVPTLGVAIVLAVIAGVALFVFWIVITIIAAVRATNGEVFRYPLTARLLR